MGLGRIAPACLRRANATAGCGPLALLQTKMRSSFDVIRSHKYSRRVSESPATQTDGNTGRQELARSASSHSPSVVEEARRKFGATIHRLREQSGLSQEQLGRDSGIATIEIKEIEAGGMDPTLFTIILLADRLGTTVEDLLRGIP